MPPQSSNPALARPRSAMLLAAGRGARLRPLTDQTPKPLLQVRGKPLIEWHLLALAQAGVQRVVINTAWLWEQFEPALGDGSRWGLQIIYSHEGRDFCDALRERGEVALETAGGIARALPMLVHDPSEAFFVAAADIWIPEHGFFSTNQPSVQAFQASDAIDFDETGRGALGHLLVVPKAAHRPIADFGLLPSGQLSYPVDVLDARGARGTPCTFSTLACYQADLFTSLQTTVPWGNPEGIAVPMVNLLREAAGLGLLTGSLHTGTWADVGTPGALASVNAAA